ncbi:Plant invertase/pectin methylesterase inhibitor superfamily [Euphorbia peplus]|nr:Plant invertase/pectin methylesterase inhibitor superfamily [Euphorbia peplus]
MVLHLYACTVNIRAQNHTITEGILTSWNPSSSRANFIVSKDGSDTYRTINDAVSAVGRSRKGNNRVIIYVKAGVYEEKVEIPKHVKELMLVGDGIDRTIITGRRNIKMKNIILCVAKVKQLILSWGCVW